MISFRLYEYLEYLKPFLVYLGYWPDRVGPIGVDKIMILDTDINMDVTIVDKLREI